MSDSRRWQRLLSTNSSGSSLLRGNEVMVVQLVNPCGGPSAGRGGADSSDAVKGTELKVVFSMLPGCLG
jgi:hypothetical protein